MSNDINKLRDSYIRNLCVNGNLEVKGNIKVTNVMTPFGNSDEATFYKCDLSDKKKIPNGLYLMYYKTSAGRYINFGVIIITTFENDTSRYIYSTACGYDGTIFNLVIDSSNKPNVYQNTTALTTGTLFYKRI